VESELSAALIHNRLEADGLLLATIDMADRTMNVFSFPLMDALEALMDRVDRDDAVRCVVLTSGKSSFLAGADLSMVRGFCVQAKTSTHAQMDAICGRLGRLFVRLEESSKPWVAAVNGLALGGGLELALACRARIVADSPKVQLGVPEIKLGLLPGAGGTQRLPRLAGYAAGMDLLLTGRSMSAQEAVTLGVFNRAVPESTLLDEACTLARSLAGRPYRPQDKFRELAQADVPAHDENAVRAEAARFGIDDETFHCYPAYRAIVESVLMGARHPMAEAGAMEMDRFLTLMFDPVAGRMVRSLFLERLRAERELVPAQARATGIRIGPLSPAQAHWQTLLSRLKIARTDASDLPADTIELVDVDGRRFAVALGSLDHPASAPDGGVAAVLTRGSAWGRTVEILGPAGPAADLLASIAPRMGVLPWPSGEATSLMARLADQPLDAQVVATLAWAARQRRADLLFVDVAACLAGVCPGWTGGPLSWLWDQPQATVDQFDAESRKAWAGIQPHLTMAFT
jgi:3-hydroxyacyl-CoA dehydrogenase / enoyl-CoA hydratase / 3-hydroxybutyryl-CoA epimerase